jgi:hypothetical protein
MKFAMTKKELLDPALVKPKMEKSLKKTIQFLMENNESRLPFHYQHGFISEKESFVSIGDAKEVEKEWKQRKKGKTTQGEAVDKKKVAQGQVYYKAENKTFYFEVEAGVMKPKDVKEAFRSIAVMKKLVKKYEIVQGAVEAATESVQGAVEAVKESADDLLKMFQEFKQGEVKDFGKKKDGTNAQALISKGTAIAQRMASFLEGTPDKQVEKAKRVIEAKVQQVESAIGKAQGKKAAGSLDKVTTDINSAIEELLSNFAEEVDGIGDTLKATLNKLKGN